MALLLFGLLLFLGAHSVAMLAPQWRARCIGRFGEPAWKRGYSLVAGLGLCAVVIGFGSARREADTLYVAPMALRHAAIALMLPVFPLLFAAHLPGRIQRRVQHPLLLAVALWGTAHVLANGSVADGLMFGGMGLWACVDMVSVRRRGAGPARVVHARRWNDAVAVVAGLASYAFVLWRGHLWMFGVSPLG